MGIAEKERKKKGESKSYGLWQSHHTLSVEMGWFICSRAICLLMREPLFKTTTKKKGGVKGKREKKREAKRKPGVITHGLYSVRP